MKLCDIKPKASLIVDVGERLEFSRCRFSRDDDLRRMSSDGKCQRSRSLLCHICSFSFVLVFE
ncbi:hypothetical protein Hanom_Chr11g01055071 [Helianthus anomalus]